MQNGLPDRINEFLKQQKVLALATRGEDMPGCCNCFYELADEESMLVIMSDEKSSHVQEARVHPKVSGTVFDPKSTMTNVRGVQFQGRFMALSGDLEKKARKYYQAKFPLAKIKGKPFWGIVLARVRLLESRAGIPYKTEWEHSDPYFMES